ncbi:hypothetical protein [Sphingomicrobium nitratireducens]|uniref:hypothetical protein n=1 Tax=Sphingomicrobium nitratireducens TaxID=2964666 RepID=UPI00223F20BA|nr:hypothetical protein [Sphingomicrobium nitratireducens]
MKTILGWTALFAVAGCAGPQPRTYVAPISHYIRSNGDGTMAEHIVHHFPTDRDIAVYKWVAKCETAAYVTAQMGGEPFEAQRLIAGKVAEDGSQAAFGELSLDPDARRLHVEVSLGGETMTEETDAGPSPWMLYDYDLADLHAMLRARPGGGDFAVSMRMIWPEQPPFFRSLGRVTFVDRGVRDGLRTYQATGDALSGTVVVGATDGQLREARFDRPNHPGYDDYLLRLERVEPGGAAAWRTITQAHYGDCPPE